MPWKISVRCETKTYLTFCARREKKCFSSALLVGKKVKEYYISCNAGNTKSVFCFVFNLQVCSLKEKRYLGIFIWSVRIQNDVFVTCPYLEWEQYPGGFAGLNDVDSNTFTESLSNWGCTSGRAASGLRVASEAMWEYGIGKDRALSPAKNTWKMVGPRQKWSQFECHFEGWEFNDKLL